MFDWQLLFSLGIIYGLVLSLALTLLMVVSGIIALDMSVGDYPPDIQQKYGPMSARAARLRPYFATLLFGIFLAVPIIGLIALRARIDYVPFFPRLHSLLLPCWCSTYST